MTPMEFSAITELRMSGKPLKYDMNMQKKKNQLEKRFGKQVSQRVDMRRIMYENLSTTYQYKERANENEVDQITRIFILCLIGSTFLNDKSQFVSLHYMPFLEKVDEIHQ